MSNKNKLQDKFADTCDKLNDAYVFCQKELDRLRRSNNDLSVENLKLKENIHSMLFTDDVVQERYDKAKEEIKELKDLLKEAQKVFKLAYNAYENENLIARIDEVLGEIK